MGRRRLSESLTNAVDRTLQHLLLLLLLPISYIDR